MSTTSVSVSVVMPAYNEEDGIAVAVAAVREHVLDTVLNSELVVVNDGSRDGTGALLDQLAADDPRVRVIHKSNGGHGPAIMTGLGQAQGAYVFLIDSDNQIPLEEFAPFWAAVSGGGDAAFGVRRVRHDAQLRKVLTVVIRQSLSTMFGVRLYDSNVPYKLLKRSLWTEASALIPEGTLAPSLFLAVFAARRGYAVTYIDVTHKDRETGTVSIRRWKLIKFCARAFRQLLDFRASLLASTR
ncbi:MAG: glycosyltransferase family 2 protein [Gemmatimonadetes bacterium]|nr:glycosyltransferase family 2 protein [Gemmatimonadota bacterium]MCC6772674.1 glycosyltransferase family 2 protein [Gemmatimonadaceae bacterium]